VVFPVHFEQCAEVPSLCAAKSEREFVDVDNQTQDTESMMAEANSRIEARTDRRSLPSRSPFWLIVYGGFRRATVRLEVVGFLMAHKIKDSNDLCGSCDHLSRAGVAGRQWGVDLPKYRLRPYLRAWQYCGPIISDSHDQNL
jgi:hypothetical protein